MRSRLLYLGLASVAVAALGSCNWGKFDDLKDDAWAQLIDRDDSGVSGDFGIDVCAVPTTGSQGGVRFVISAGLTAGLAQATFDENGDLIDTIGFDGDASGAGQIRPIRTTNSTPFVVIPYKDNTFLAGIPDQKIVAEYETGLQNGRAIVEGGVDRTGEALAVGDLGVGTATLDVVAVSGSSVIVLPDGSSTGAFSCALRPPRKNGTPPLVPLENVKIARMAGGTGAGQIIIAGEDQETATPRIYILDASQVQGAGGADCPTGASFVVTAPAPGSIAVADIDGNGPLDIIAGTLGQSSAAGRVTVYLNPSSGTPTPVEITSELDDKSSPLRGSRIRVANIDEDAASEIIVGDAAGSPDNVSAAGQVQLFRWGSSGSCPEQRGPACLVRTIFDPDPDTNGFFGRALAIGQFKKGAATSNVLAVAQKDQVVVYFRVSTADQDPRN